MPMGRGGTFRKRAIRQTKILKSLDLPSVSEEKLELLAKNSNHCSNNQRNNPFAYSLRRQGARRREPGRRQKDSPSGGVTGGGR